MLIQMQVTQNLREDLKNLKVRVTLICYRNQTEQEKAFF